MHRHLGQSLRNTLNAVIESADMPHDFFDPTPEQQNVLLVNAATLRQAEKLVESCEACNPEHVEIPFDWILDRVIGSDSSVTDYILEEPAKSGADALPRPRSRRRTALVQTSREDGPRRHCLQAAGQRLPVRP